MSPVIVDTPADRSRRVVEGKQRVQRAETDLAGVYDSIRASHPDITGEPLEKLARELVIAQARLEVAKIRLSVSEDAAKQ